MDGPRDCQTNDLILFPFIAEKYSIVYMYHNFLIHSSVDRHLSCFHVLAIINSAAMNIGVHVSLSVLVFLVCMPSSGIAGLYGNSISSFLRNLHTVLHNGYTSAHRLVIFHYIYVPQLSYPFICWWTSRLLPYPGYYKQCCNEHWGTRAVSYTHLTLPTTWQACRSRWSPYH